MLAIVMLSSLLASQQAPTELAPGTLLFPTAAGNVMATVTAEGAFVVGPLTAASTPAIQAAIATRTSSPARYVVAAPHAAADREGDGGWRGPGIFVTTQEQLYSRIQESVRPVSAFSEFIKFNVGGQDMHCVHQQPGYSNADVLVHFENVGIVYLGESLAGDGYPIIDSAHGGTLEGLLQTINPWTGAGRNRMVGAFGPAQTGADVRAFRDMIVTARDRVRTLAQAGRTADQIVAERPTREFDARYGSGRVTPEQFVRQLYRAVRN